MFCYNVDMRNVIRVKKKKRKKSIKCGAIVAGAYRSDELISMEFVVDCKSFTLRHSRETRGSLKTWSVNTGS